MENLHSIVAGFPGFIGLIVAIKKAITGVCLIYAFAITFELVCWASIKLNICVGSSQVTSADRDEKNNNVFYQPVFENRFQSTNS